MPIKIPNKLPARETLNGENIFVIDEDRALAPGHSRIKDRHPESDAHQDRHRNPIITSAGQFTPAGGYHPAAHRYASEQEHIRRTST